MRNPGLICDCGFEFSGPGEFRNCGAFITGKGTSGVVCPECGQEYIEGYPVDTKHDTKDMKEKP